MLHINYHCRYINVYVLAMPVTLCLVQVIQTCSASPSGASLCTFGLSVDSLFDSALLLLGLGDFADIAEALTPAERVALALNMLISVKPKTTFGASLPSQDVVMSNK